ncbi:MAG: Asp-tRNA(Asn)/Glu-tRNA(Gln) amidotransferase subunit GatC [Alphaproteobacteria bacterium]
MAEITTKDINKIARLAMIEINEQKAQELTKQIGNVLTWVKTLDEIDTNNIIPLTNVSDHTLEPVNDEVKDGNIASQVLANSKNATYGYFSVPKVIE